MNLLGVKGLVLALALFVFGCSASGLSEGDAMYDDDPGQYVGKNGWSSSGQLQQGNPNKQLQCAANFTAPGQYTVQFSAQQPPYNGWQQRSYAEVIWSVEGNSVRRLISIYDGASLSGVGQGATITMYDDSNNIVAGPGDLYNVSIQVARGTRPSQNQPPVYMPNAGIAPFAWRVLAGSPSASIPIPQNIGAISINLAIAPFTPTQAIAANSVVVTILDNTGDVLKTYYYESASDFVPLPPGAAQFVIHNNAANALAWFVSYGIDG